MTFDYGPERGRFKKTVGTSSQVDETTLYLGKAYERIETASGGVTHKYFIYAGGHLAAVHIQTEDGQGQVDHSQDKTRYMHHGALGSLDTITAEDGTVEEQLFYSPFGAKRNKYWEPLGGTSLYLETNRNQGVRVLDSIKCSNQGVRVLDFVDKIFNAIGDFIGDNIRTIAAIAFAAITGYAALIAYIGPSTAGNQGVRVLD